MKYRLKQISDPGACVHCRFGALVQILFRSRMDDPLGGDHRVINRVACGRLDCDYHEGGDLKYPPPENIIGVNILRTNEGLEKEGV